MTKPGFFQRFVHKPQQMRARWWIFQIHLWAGVILALYMVVVGVSGSILVFREELTAFEFSHLMKAPDGIAPVADLSAIVANVRKQYPQERIASIRLPALYCENFRVNLANENGVTVYVDPVHARVLGQTQRAGWWITWMQQLHFYLLGGKTGLLVNGAGGLLLCLLCITGLVIWWPGLARWASALLINFRAGWKRINWDLHSATGFWTLSIVFAWGLTGAFFAWPLYFGYVVNQFSPVTNAFPKSQKVQPPLEAPANYADKLDLQSFVEKAKLIYPATDFAGIDFPANPKAPLTVLMARGERWNTRATNYVYFDPFQGHALGSWERGVNHTVGDAIIFLMGPVHFGVYWGMTIKIIWAVLGFALSILSVTGVLMYWNRSLSKLWRMRKLRSQPSPVSATSGPQKATIS